MPKRKYTTSKGTFIVDSNRPLSQSELEKHIEVQRIKDMSLGEIVSENFVNSLKSMHSEVLSPIGKRVDTTLLGAPRTLLKSLNPDLDKKLFPDQKTLRGKVFNIGSQVRGLLKGFAAKAGKKVAQKAGVLGARTFGKKVGEAAIIGGTTGALQLVGEPEEDIVSQVGKQGLQAALGAGISAGFPVAGAGLGKGKEFLNAVSKGKAGYLSDVIVPKMMDKIGRNISSGGTKLLNYAKTKLNIPENSLRIINSKGEVILDEVFAATRGQTDDIATRLQGGMLQRRNIADEAYSQAIDSVPENHLFAINKTRSTIKNGLRKKGLLNSAGQATDRARIATSPDKILIDIYDDMSRTPEATKTDFSFYRDKLSSLYKETGTTNRDVFKATSALYDDAADSGFRGLQEARNLQKQAFNIEDRFLKSTLIKENKLNKYNKWTSAEKRELNDLVDYIENDFPIDAGIIDDLESTIASRDLQVLKNKITSPEVVRKDLLSATNKENFNTIRNKWSSILDEPVDDIFNEVRQAETGRKVISVGKRILLTGGLGYGAYRLGDELLSDLIGR